MAGKDAEEVAGRSVFPEELLEVPLKLTLSTISIILFISLSTNRSIVLYKPANGSSPSSRIWADVELVWLKPVSKGFCLEANAVNGVYGVRGGSRMFEIGAAGWLAGGREDVGNGVWGSKGL